MVRGARIVGLVLSFSTFAWIAPSSAATHTGVCSSLEQCWAELFPEVRKTLGDVSAVLEQYIGSARQRIAGSSGLMDDAEARLLYRSSLCDSFLEECRSIQGVVGNARFPLSLIVVGKSADLDETYFEDAAKGLFMKELRKKCSAFSKTSNDFTECKKSVVILHPTSKSAFLRTLELIKPHSLASFTYVGHGTTDQIVISERNLTYPPEAFHKTYKTWAEGNEGALYNYELQSDSPFGRALRKAFHSGTQVTFYSCKTGQGFAGVFAHAAGVPSATAAKGAMHFALVDADGNLIEDPGNKNVPKKRPGTYVGLVPDKTGDFGPITQLVDLLAQTSPGKPATRDELAEYLLSRLEHGLYTEARFGTRGSETIIRFNPSEVRRVRELMSHFKAKRGHVPKTEAELFLLFSGEEDLKIIQKLLTVLNASATKAK